jgi:hypothetical protein
MARRGELVKGENGHVVVGTWETEWTLWTEWTKWTK